MQVEIPHHQFPESGRLDRNEVLSTLLQPLAVLHHAPLLESLLWLSTSLVLGSYKLRQGAVVFDE